MTTEDHVLAGLVIVLLVIAGQLLSAKLRVPAAILLVLLGLGVGFIPHITAALSLTPEMVLLLFLPPLIYNAAFFSSPRDMRINARPIVALAVGMTLLVAFAVAGAVYWVLPGVTWPMAIAFGAAVAPTDAVSASAVLKRVGAPQHIVTVLEGESLINDGVALTLFTMAVTAMVTPLTVADGIVELLRVVLGGVVYGVIFSLLVVRFRSLFRDSGTQLVVSLLIPFAAYIPADLLGFSGVLATVIAGFYLGVHGDGLLPPRVRVTGRTIWKGLVRLLESTLFVLPGLQLHTVLEARTAYAPSEVIWAAVVVTTVTILIRLVWETIVTPSRVISREN
ncbi:cation:proton antiporter [Spiractinospora alimapuensis]|uniref:cation:proton antiporter n=1 Tax=Spiractinospora alimapuensis TaxID=2820884 RepID=UPI002ED6FB8F